MNIKGLIAATYTPMKKDESVNLDIVAKYASYLKENNVEGAFVNGSTGDFVSLTTEERKLIIDAWSINKPEDFYLINHVGHTSLHEAMDLTRHSASKVDAIAALAPYYFKLPTIESLVSYCEKIASCAPNLPFYYYHIPVLTGADFSMVKFLELASKKIPNLAGIKFTNNNLIDYKYCKDYDNGNFNILFGIDELFLAGTSFGANGWVGSTYNHLGPLYTKIYDAFLKKDMEKAADLQKKAMKFVDILNAKGGYNGAAKSFMKALGVDCGPSRFPHTTLTDVQLQEVVKELEDVGILEYTGKISSTNNIL